MAPERLGSHPSRAARAARAAWSLEQATVADLRERRWLRLHVLLLAGLCTALCGGLSAALRAAGVDSLLWRPVLALLLTWPIYLGLLWLWGRWLISREDGTEAAADAIDLVDLVDLGMDLGGAAIDSAPTSGELTGQVLSGAADAVSGADELAIVTVPLVAVVGVALALGAALGFVVFGLFGVEILIGVAVEIAFASVGGALAWRARREGWLTHALRRTVWPMLGLLLAVAAAGWALQTWMPEAQTWPQALRMFFA